jgi:hypothetical protein
MYVEFSVLNAQHALPLEHTHCDDEQHLSYATCWKPVEQGFGFNTGGLWLQYVPPAQLAVIVMYVP